MAFQVVFPLTTEGCRAAGETEDRGLGAGCPRASMCEGLKARLSRLFCLPQLYKGDPLSRDCMRKFLGPPDGGGVQGKFKS